MDYLEAFLLKNAKAAKYKEILDVLKQNIFT